jgi:hypothetical protein
MGVEHEAGAACLHSGGGVEGVAPDGVAYGLQVQPQLVGATCEGLQFQQ